MLQQQHKTKQDKPDSSPMIQPLDTLPKCLPCVPARPLLGQGQAWVRPLPPWTHSRCFHSDTLLAPRLPPASSALPGQPRPPHQEIDSVLPHWVQCFPGGVPSSSQVLRHQDLVRCLPYGPVTPITTRMEPLTSLSSQKDRFTSVGLTVQGARRAGRV